MKCQLPWGRCGFIHPFSCFFKLLLCVRATLLMAGIRASAPAADFLDAALVAKAAALHVSLIGL